MSTLTLAPQDPPYSLHRLDKELYDGDKIRYLRVFTIYQKS